MRATPVSTVLALALALLVCAETAHGQAHRMTQRDYTGLLAVSHQYVAPVSYDALWDSLVVACGCKPAAFLSDILWYEAPRGGFYCAGTNAACIGLWASNGAVFIAADSRADRRVIAHEMLHAILGRGDHPALFSLLHLGGDND